MRACYDNDNHLKTFRISLTDQCPKQRQCSIVRDVFEPLFQRLVYTLNISLR
jgi:hypothetical protein